MLRTLYRRVMAHRKRCVRVRLHVVGRCGAGSLRHSLSYRSVDYVGIVAEWHGRHIGSTRGASPGAFLRLCLPRPRCLARERC